MAKVKIERTAKGKTRKAVGAATAKASSSSSCHITRLSDDILIQIFVMLYTLWPTHEHSSRTELAVCQTWRHLIIDTPLLWTKIYVPDVEGRGCFYNDHSFERSQGALLDLIISPEVEDVSGSSGKLTMDHVAQNQSRIRSLTVTSFSSIPVALLISSWNSKTMKMITPALTKVKILIDYPGGRDIFSSFFGDRESQALDIGRIPEWGGISSLTTLELAGFDASRFPHAPNVRSLQLGAVKLTVQALKDILSRFPVLDTFTVAELQPIGYTTPPAHNTHDDTTIYAPSLRKLGFGTYHGHGAECPCGVTFLAAPNLVYLELQCKSGFLGHRHFTRLLHPDNTVYLQKIRLGSRVVPLSKPVAKFLSKIRTDSVELQFSWLLGPERAHEWIKGLLESVSMKSITVDFALAKTWWSFRAKKNAKETAVALKEAAKLSPISVRGLTHDKFTLQELQDALDGSGVTILRSSTEDWLVPRWDSFCEDHSDNEEESDSDSDYTYFGDDSDEGRVLLDDDDGIFDPSRSYSGDDLDEGRDFPDEDEGVLPVNPYRSLF